MNNTSTRTSTLPTKLKTERSMPKWVTEANDRIGPKPPAPPPIATTNGGSKSFRPPALPPKNNQTEPDYEVIEFSNQQYSNEPTMRPKTPDARRPESVMKCTLCGSNNPWVTCDECAQQIFCASCDDMFHKHPKRKTHLRKAIEPKKGSIPFIPPKALNPVAPVAPPRRNKKGMPSPMPLRRDQVIGSAATTPSISPAPGSQPQQPAWQDRLGSLRRGLNLGNRPLPETPRTPSDEVSSRSTTPNSKSVFDQIQKPPSITLEKIKTKASATLDRMALLQQRYRQHKQSKPNEKINVQREQTLPSDQWSNISSPSQFRSGSMSSGINSFDYPDESSFHFNQQMPMQGMRGQGPSGRSMSTSVFNLNQMGHRHNRDQQSPMWMGGGSQMQQAQSMAQLNCINCHSHGGWNQPQHHPEDWPGAANSSLNRSNMSLNVTHGFYPSPHNQHMMHAPPMFMNMPGMYPYPIGMPVTAMNPGMMGMPSSGRSRVASRASSRVPSPTHSRKSMQVRSKKRNDFSENELTDDEDSDNDDRRSLMSQRSGLANTRRTRRVSSVSQNFDQEEPRSVRSKAISSRDHRGPSMPKSVQDEWTPTRRPSIVSNANSNFNSYRKVYSDSPISPDSETSEAPPTRALVQAKIQEKMKESSSKAKPNPLVFSDSIELPQKLETKSLPEPDEVEYQNGNESKPSTEAATNSNAEDSSSLGPPPSTPEHEWECEFCTFVNEPKTKICSICCKTPKQAPQKVIPKQPATSATAKVSTSTITTASGTNGIAKLKISQQTEDETEDYAEAAAAKKKDIEPIEDIWATLDENIQAEAKKAQQNAETSIEYKKSRDQQTSDNTLQEKIKIQKVSTGCGPSPPKEIPRELRSTATSPVPQSMSTQTYDTVSTRNEDNHPKTTETSTDMSTTDFQNHSFTPPTRNFSPREMFNSMPPEPSTSREAENLALMDRNLRFYREIPVRPNDLPSTMQATRPQIPDYLSMQKAQTYHNDIFFDPYATSKRNEPTRDPEIELFMMLKEAEHYKFTAEELHAALKNCGDTHPIVWLRENWSKLVQTVQSLATKYGQERIENVIGTISAIEAREALRMHGGNVWQAISECVEQRQRKYLEISAKGNYSREDIVTALTAHHGNMDLALLDLSKTQLKPFLMRVWGSPGGVENESANFMQPTSPLSAPKSEISSPIHEFLAANADQIAFTQDQASYKNAHSTNNQFESKDDLFGSQSTNKNVLKDLEILIGNMEQVQAKQNSQVFRGMEDMLGNLLAKKLPEAELDTEAERIFMKSPIYSNRNVTNSRASNQTGNDVKNFVWQHIQDIVPNLVEQVERNLLESSPPVLEEAVGYEEPPPIDADEFLMEEVIRPNLKLSTEEEEPEVQLEVVESIPDFKADKDRGLMIKQLEEYKLKSFANAPRLVYKMERAHESESEEDQSSEEESSEEEDSQEEISSRNSKNHSIIPKNDDLKNKSDSPELKLNTVELTPAINDETLLSAKSSVGTPVNVPNVLEDRSDDTPSTKVETNEDSKKDKSQGSRGFTFRFGFNSSRRSRRARKRRSIKRDNKNVEKEIEDTETDQSLDHGTENVSLTPDESQNQNDGEKQQNQKSPIETETVDHTIINEEIKQSIENETAHSQPTNNDEIQHIQLQVTNIKSNKNVKRSTKIPSTFSRKHKRDSEMISQNNQFKKEVETITQTVEKNTTLENSEVENGTNTTNASLDVTNTTFVKSETANNQPTLDVANTTFSKSEASHNQPILESSLQPKTLEKKNHIEDDNKPSTSSPRKASQLKKPKTQNTEVQTITKKTEGTKLVPNEVSDSNSTTIAPNLPQKVPDTKSVNSVQDSSTSSLNAGESVKEQSVAQQQNATNIETAVSPILKKKPTSRIPVRRTTSSTSLKSIENVSNSLTLTPTTVSSKSSLNLEDQSDQKDFSTEDDDSFQDVQSSSSEDETEPNFYNALEEVIETTVDDTDTNSVAKEEDGNNSDQELLSIESEEPNTLSTRDLMQSPTSENEVLLILDNQSSSHSTTITPVSSNKSIDFKYSDQSKQNLSELVEDTQRLIKQMKEEINIDMAAYDSEDDDDDYSDDYSYEEYEEEYEEEGEEEEEEDEEDFEEEEETENDEQHSTADIEENDIDENRNNLEIVQEEIGQYHSDDAGEIEESNSLPHTSSADHVSLVVVENNENNTSNQENTDLNNSSIVSGGSPENATISETLTRNSGPVVETDSVDQDLEIDRPLLHTESQGQETSNLVTPQVLEDDGKPSTSKPLTKDTNQTQDAKMAPQKESQNQKTDSVAVEDENTLKENGNQFNDEVIEESSSVEQLQLKKLSQPTEKEIPILRSVEDLNEVESNVNENSTLVEPVTTVQLSRSDISPQTPTLLNNHPGLNETPNQLSSPDLEHQSITSEEQITLSEEQNDSNESLEINETLPETSNLVIQQQMEPSENSVNVVELVSIPNIRQSLSPETTSTTLSSSPSSSSLVSALKGLLKNDESPTEEPISSKISVTNNQSTEENSNTHAFPPTNDNQDIKKTIPKPTTSQNNDDVPTTSKNSTERKSPTKKIVSKIPKPKVNTKPTPVPTRSKSFSAPSPIGVSSVRAIQQELFNKQAQLTKSSALVSQKPAPPKLIRKKSITDAISKFTQATSEHTVLRSRTQPKIPKIPKKKYHETCFSDDDYQGSSSEEEQPQPVEARLRKQSAPVFRTYASIKELQVEQPEICARRLIDEQLVSNMAEAQIAAALVGMRFQQDVSIWAAKECCDLEQAITLLQQECELCMGSYPLNEIVSMLKCTHKCCKQCAKNYFTIQITDRSINDCNCPFCKTPELNDPNVLEDENLEYFSNLDIFIKNIVEPEVHELFQRKLRDRTLMQDPNFKWCIQCSSGFFARPKQKRLICPDCGSVTCSQCRKTWEKQHEGLTCEKFQEWKEANDPEVQAKGVAEHLALNGIDCPKCRFKYSLARGGCMHFTCTQCKFEFCYGCGRPFMMGAKCTVSPYCSKLGLHSHHPRSCLFYLRDKEPHTLQNLLLQNNVQFDVEPISIEGAVKSGAPTKCPIPLQKETPKGLVDTVCNTEVQKDHAGLCRQHYVEYLANKVSKANIDPLPILDLTDCVQELRRRGLPLPERGPWDTDEIYRDMCSKVIKEKIPL